MEARRSLVGRPVFKTGVGGEKLPGWVRFPCASANLFHSSFSRSLSQLHSQTGSIHATTLPMKLFSPLYRRAMIWSRHPHAPWYLAAMSFAESSFFPVPPDVMLAPMSLATPSRAWRFALITTVASVAGGLLGYGIGYFALDAIMPWLQQSKYWPAYQTAVNWFDRWGFWAVFIAGFSPIPYKVFTIAAGALSMALAPFTLASIIGRGARFFLVAGLMAWGGERMEGLLHRYIDRLGWLTVALVALGALVYNLG
jgi:membrane protein YqaA with SNARE-associated domain